METEESAQSVAAVEKLLLEITDGTYQNGADGTGFGPMVQNSTDHRAVWCEAGTLHHTLIVAAFSSALVVEMSCFVCSVENFYNEEDILHAFRSHSASKK